MIHVPEDAETWDIPWLGRPVAINYLGIVLQNGKRVAVFPHMLFQGKRRGEGDR